MSARPATIGSTSFGMSRASYWLSASVLTTMSAPSLRHASRPASNAAARPLLFVRRTMWSTPWARATSTVRSVDPSSTTSHSTTSTPATSRGRVASVPGSCSSSSLQGIWMMSFTGVRLPFEYVSYVALTHGLRLPQHPDFGQDVGVAALVEHLRAVGAAHFARLAEHPRLLRRGPRGGGPADG